MYYFQYDNFEHKQNDHIQHCVYKKACLIEQI